MTKGLVRSVGGTADRDDVGDDAYVLLARVRFASTDDDRVPVGRSGGTSVRTTCRWLLAERPDGTGGRRAGGAHVGRVAGDGAVGGDVRLRIEDTSTRSTSATSRSSPPRSAASLGDPADEPPFVWWADFDKSGRVDFGDLAFFAPNFGKTREAVQSGDQTLVFPPNFPDAWRPGRAVAARAKVKVKVKVKVRE
jgi:hypothetical protein